MNLAKIILPIVTLFCIFTSCDDVDTTILQIQGEWSFMTYSCFCPTINSFNNGDIVWDFQSNGTVVLTFNTTLLPDSNVPFQNVSSMNYTVNGNLIELDGYEYDLVIDGDDMNISDDPASDGSIFFFER